MTVPAGDGPVPHEPDPGHPHDPHEHDHEHQQDHVHHDGGAHGHPHQPATEMLPDPSGPGSVVADIGGTVGAAVVTTPPSLDGEEIEIRPEPGAWTGRHVAVRPRPLADRTIHAAFFEALDAGSYLLRVRFAPSGAVEVPLTVTGGTVTQIAWPES